jgi:regulatory protein
MKPFKPAGQHELKQAEKPDDVTNYGLWLLGRRDHSVQELRTKLGRKTGNSDWIEQSVDKLQEWGYLNEQKFIDNFIRNCNEIKHYGPMRIRHELRLKGADKDIANTALQQCDFDYFEAARQYLNKKYPNPIEDRKERDRITRFLANKGFSFDMIRYAFDEHLKEADEP